ncbi:MAG TPA: helix-turn-helix domain-containing protein, partial [Gemmatimonadaceae bacterium]|nr:helix-turn-helix domain-containing protein [Gemmatimonadaceae bacterium]
MPSPCSLDLRERVVATVLSGELSHAKIARLFSVSQSSLHRWLGE